MEIKWFPHWRCIEAGGGYIKSVTLADHEQALAEIERKNVENLKQIDEEHERALAEKDREIAHLQDVYIKQRHKQEDAYQQLMEKAVRFAETVVKIHDFCGVESSDIESSMFLNSPEVQAWKEQP